MADLKISALPAATLPLTGAELVPIVQSGTTKNVTAANLSAGFGPAFRAYSSNAQSISSATTTKIEFNAELFDTNNNFDSTTNYRFTPTVAGYYQVNLAVGFAAMSVGEVILQINKNGAVYQYGADVVGTTTYITSMSTLVDMNGSTDYIEGFVYQGSGLSRALATSTTQCTFSGALVRSN
jgi:hypothetical protein